MMVMWRNWLKQDRSLASRSSKVLHSARESRQKVGIHFKIMQFWCHQFKINILTVQHILLFSSFWAHFFNSTHILYMLGRWKLGFRNFGWLFPKLKENESVWDILRCARILSDPPILPPQIIQNVCFFALNISADLRGRRQDLWDPDVKKPFWSTFFVF